jgi:ECF sigma factor
MTDDQSSLVSQLLRHWTEGDEKALTELLPLVYNELRRVARFHLQRERPDHTLQIVFTKITKTGLSCRAARS